jgi:hypothetical protein
MNAFLPRTGGLQTMTEKKKEDDYQDHEPDSPVPKAAVAAGIAVEPTAAEEQN